MMSPLVKLPSGCAFSVVHGLDLLPYSEGLFASKHHNKHNPLAPNHLQAATVASSIDAANPQPHEGDGYLYEHLGSGQESLWLDFIADTGDGG